MLRATIDTALVIASSMILLPCGHREALPEVQRQMRLINHAYPDPRVLRFTDEVVREASALHGPPGSEPESELRAAAQQAIERLRTLLETLPSPPPIGRDRRRARAR